MKVLPMTDRLHRSLVGSLVFAALCPRTGAAQATIIVATVQDSTGAPIFPCRIEVIGTQITQLGDSLGRVVLHGVPPGPHVLRVGGIGFFQRVVKIDARGDTLHLPPVILRHNRIFDSRNLVPNQPCWLTSHT